MFESWFKQFKIVYVNNKYIPYVKTRSNFWEGIQQKNKNNYDLWYCKELVYKYCAEDTEVKAEEVINNYKQYLENQIEKVVKYV